MGDADVGTVELVGNVVVKVMVGNKDGTSSHSRGTVDGTSEAIPCSVGVGEGGNELKVGTAL